MLNNNNNFQHLYFTFLSLCSGQISTRDLLPIFYLLTEQSNSPSSADAGHLLQSTFGKSKSISGWGECGAGGKMGQARVFQCTEWPMDRVEPNGRVQPPIPRLHSLNSDYTACSQQACTDSKRPIGVAGASPRVRGWTYPCPLEAPVAPNCVGHSQPVCSNAG